MAIADRWELLFGRRDPRIRVGLNYYAHSLEAQMDVPEAPLLFAKFSNTLRGDGETIVLPEGVGHVDAEVTAATKSPIERSTVSCRGTGGMTPRSSAGSPPGATFVRLAGSA